MKIISLKMLLKWEIQKDRDTHTISILHVQFMLVLLYKVGLDSVVGIATRYVPDGPGIESRYGWTFCTRSNRSWGPHAHL